MDTIERAFERKKNLQYNNSRAAKVLLQDYSEVIKGALNDESNPDKWRRGNDKEREGRRMENHQILW